jgi:hypothetical protein
MLYIICNFLKRRDRFDGCTDENDRLTPYLSPQITA